MLAVDFKESFGRCAQLAGMPALCALFSVSATNALAVPVLCAEEPTCEVLGLERLHNGDYELIVPECPESCMRSGGGDDPCSDPTFCVLVDSPCPTDPESHALRVSLRPDIDPGDPSEDVRMIADEDSPQMLCFEVPGICEYEEGEEFEVEVLVDDLANDRKSSCIIKVKVICGKPVWCSLDGFDTAGPRGTADSASPVVATRHGSRCSPAPHSWSRRGTPRATRATRPVSTPNLTMWLNLASPKELTGRSSGAPISSTGAPGF
jgi:hypothetical protein